MEAIHTIVSFDTTCNRSGIFRPDLVERQIEMDNRLILFNSFSKRSANYTRFKVTLSKTVPAEIDHSKIRIQFHYISYAASAGSGDLVPTQVELREFRIRLLK